MTHSHLIGAPDLVVEVLSPGTMSHDLHKKRDAYEQAQVPEYWIVSPAERVVEVFIPGKEDYRSLGVFQEEAILPSRVVPSWSVPVKRLFAFL